MGILQNKLHGEKAVKILRNLCFMDLKSISSQFGVFFGQSFGAFLALVQLIEISNVFAACERKLSDVKSYRSCKKIANTTKCTQK